MKMKGQM
jgi:hypothetical protein